MFIEFGILSYKLFILLLYPIFCQFSLYLLHDKTSALYNTFMGSINYLSAGLIYLIVLNRSNITKKLTSKKNLKGKLVAVNQIYIENKLIQKKRKIKEMFLIFMLSFIFPIPLFIDSFAQNKIYSSLNCSIGVLFYILYNVFFSNLILNSKLYRHQIISLVILIFSLVIYLFIDFQTLKKNFDSFRFWISIFYFIVTLGLHSLFNNLTKIHLENYSENPYQLMFFIGLFSLILLIILNLFLYFFKIDILGDDAIKQILKLFSSKNILRFIFDIFVGFLWNVGIFLTVYYFTPCHLIISETFYEFLAKFIGWIIGKNEEDKKNTEDKWYFIMIYCILYCIMFFSSLIYNEVVIIKFCSMQKNTYKYITLRQKLEFKDIQNSYEDELSSENSEWSLELQDESKKEEEKDLYSEL